MTAYNPNSPELQAVLAHQQLLTQATAKVQEIESAIALQEQIAAQVAEHKNTVGALQVKHQDVLAEIAIGNDCTQERDAVEAKLFEQQNQLAQLNAQAAPEQTMLGLRRKLEQAQAEIQKLASKTAGLLRNLVKTEAEAIGAEYACLAFALREKLGRVQGLSMLWGRYGGHVPLWNGVPLEIPSLRLDSVQCHPHKLHNSNVLIGTNLDTGAVGFQMLAQEEKRLQAVGVELPSMDS